MRQRNMIRRAKPDKESIFASGNVSDTIRKLKEYEAKKGALLEGPCSPKRRPFTFGKKDLAKKAGNARFA